MALGLKKGDRVALVSEARNLWVIAEMGILYAGGINVPISVKINEAHELKFRLAHSGCRMVVVSRNHSAKVLAIETDLPDLETVILLDGGEKGPDQIAVDRLIRLGEEWLAAHPGAFEARWRSVKEDDPANICYTSGTTADPKGVILTHKNYVVNVGQGARMIEILPDWRSLIVLPWDHSFGHTVGIYIMMLWGAKLASVQAGNSAMDTLRNIPENIREVRPHIMLSVPALATNFRRNIEKGVRQKGPKAEKLFQMALENAYAYIGDGWDKGRGWRAMRAPTPRLLRPHPVLEDPRGTRGRAEVLRERRGVAGPGHAAVLLCHRDPHVPGVWAHGSLARSSPRTPRMRTSWGPPAGSFPDLELRICDGEGRALPPGERGEITVRGENVMAGYWRNESATAATIRDGWLFTGDVGTRTRTGTSTCWVGRRASSSPATGRSTAPRGSKRPWSPAPPSSTRSCSGTSRWPTPWPSSSLTGITSAMAPGHGLSCITEEGQDAALNLFRDAIDAFREGGDRAGMFDPHGCRRPSRFWGTGSRRRTR
jgi:long-chain acyl-CoA synthetase